MSDQPITEVIIDTHGPTITIRAAAPLPDVLAAALKAYHETRVHHPGPRPPENHSGVAGFTTELRDTPPVQPSSMHWAPGPYPVQP